MFFNTTKHGAFQLELNWGNPITGTRFRFLVTMNIVQRDKTLTAQLREYMINVNHTFKTPIASDIVMYEGEIAQNGKAYFHRSGGFHQTGAVGHTFEAWPTDGRLYTRLIDTDEVMEWDIVRKMGVIKDPDLNDI